MFNCIVALGITVLVYVKSDYRASAYELSMVAALWLLTMYIVEIANSMRRLP